MIGVDSNVVLRWLLNDDPEQTKAAARVFHGGEAIYFSQIVLAETAWVLARSYRLSRAAIAQGLRQVITTSDAVVSDRDVILAALTAYETGGPGLSDHLIGHLNHAAGCRTTLTFDKKATDGNLFTQVL